MTPLRPSMPNLPPGQRATQRLVDEFNLDESTWREEQKRGIRDHLSDLLKRLRESLLKSAAQNTESD